MTRLYDAVDDPYTYEKSTVLINKGNIRQQDELDAFETEITFARSLEPLPSGRLDFKHYCAIHHHLFQDVYDWAGQIRTVRMAKGGNAFCFPENIKAQANKLFASLIRSKHFKDLSAAKFAQQSAHFLAELNAIHPFREGNGRSQLTFLALLAHEAGHALDLDKLQSPEAMLKAMIESFEGDERPLALLIATLFE